MKTLVVNEIYHKKKLSKFLLAQIPNLNFGTFCKLLRKKDIKINGKRVSQDCLLSVQDEVIVYLPDEKIKNPIAFSVVYEDDCILLVNKPANLEVTGTNSLTSEIHKLYQNCAFLPMPCHRIDRNTLGLVLFAKNEQTLCILFDKFKNREIEKHYLAWVYGIPSISPGTIKKEQDFLFKDQKKSKVYISSSPKKGYQKIITYYSILKKIDSTSCLLDVEIETGRTHQIRAHLAYLGYPIIGDGKYGKNEINKRFHAKTQKLCSYQLKFNFSSPSGPLEYLSQKVFVLPDAYHLLR